VSLQVTIEIGGELKDQLADLEQGLQDKAGLHARMAGDAERWIKSPDVAGRISAEQHRSANKLGAQPTGHLADAYEAIEGVSDDDAASLLIPRASRLRAAFGSYALVPKDSEFLTIPTHQDSYGRRAREFDDLFIISRPGKALMLARRSDDEPSENDKFALRARTYKRAGQRDKDAGIEVMYVLLKEVEIDGDPTLIPQDELREVALLAAGDFIDDAIERSLGS
jgi:hypothetical protein